MKPSTHANTPRGSTKDDGGFTLVELLITLVIGPIVIGGLVAMIMLVFSTQTGVSNRLSGAVNAQVTTTNLQSDVQNASYVTTAKTPSCGSTGTQIFGTETDGTAVVVSYDIVKNTGATHTKGTPQYSLVRYSCASTNTTAPTGRTTLTDDIPAAQTVSVSCSSTCTTSTGWTSSAIISAVSLSVAEPHTGVSYSLISTPRAWSPPAGSSGGSPQPDITVLGSSTATNDCTDAALSLGSDSGIQYGGGNDEVTWGSTCTTTSSQSSSTWNGQSETYSSWYNQYGGTSTTSSTSTTSDPLGGETLPTYTNPGGTGTCSNGTCSTGDNGSTTTISGPCTFGSGTYVFTQPVTITSGSVTFGSGTYVFEGGLTVQGSSKCNLGTGTFICSSTTNSGNGFCCKGSCSVSCSSSGCCVYVNKGCTSFSNTGGTSLCGKTSCGGVCLWDSCSNPSSSTPCVSLCGTTSSSTPCSYGGVYCSSGTVSCSGGKCTSSFVDCGALSVGSGSTLCVG